MSITAIIPAYNEERYIGGVLSVLQQVDCISQIIVVSDGSTDNTACEAERRGVDVIRLPQNVGKGGALAVGLRKAREEIVLFMDADLIGLTPEHVLNLVVPVINREVDMTVGVFENGRLATDMAQVVAPFLSGQRCLRKKWLQGIEELLATSGFGVETVLTHLATQKHMSVMHIHLPNLSHVMKEEKLGLVKGLAYRLKMYWEITKNVRTGG